MDLARHHALADTGPAGPSVQGSAPQKGDTCPQGPAGVDGAWFPKGFWITNKSVGLTRSGADFGPYADAGSTGGSLLYTGFNGQKLKETIRDVFKSEDFTKF